MNILVAHNLYKQPGGEDQCVAAEIAMLRAYGHEVTPYSLSNDSIDAMTSFQVATRTIYSRPAFHQLRRLFRKERPQIAHFHNTFPLISPAAYYAARAENVPVVQTLHNFRLCCVNAALFRDGKVCEDCLGKSVAWPGIVHKCYHGRRDAAAVVAGMQTLHRLLGTWRKAVDVYVALSQSSRRKLIEGGLPADKIVVKPNFAHPDPGPGAGGGGFAVYVGRLATEKGLETLLAAWRQLDGSLPLKIIGDGPMAAAVQEAAAKDAAIQWMGSMPLEAVYELVGAATLLTLPSQCYENFPRVLIEAFAKGTPVVASRLGAMAEIVADGRTGLLFNPGDPADLAGKVRSILADLPRLARMRRAARQEFEENFTADTNHGILVAIYERALAGRPQRALRGSTRP
jgi:glycosyltransferase involved in cell wall biosynthesis